MALPTSTAVRAWSGLALVERIAEGNRNEVWRGEIDGTAVAVRRSRRSRASLDWELDLIAEVDRAGFLVPTVVPSDDGSRDRHGIVVQRWIEGRPPTTPDDQRAVAAELLRLHDLTVGHAQRPGCVSVTELGRVPRSVDADLSVIPDDARAQLLAVFSEFGDVATATIHGDPGPSNLRITDDGRVGLLDWDESRVDVVWHDLSELGVQVLDDESHARAQRLSNAWETANAWIVEPEYARRRLAALSA